MPLPPFSAVLEDHGPALLRFCLHEAGPDAGEDVFQEAMLAALRAYDTVRDPEAVRGWLFAIAARKTIDAHRARDRTPTPVAEPRPPGVETPGAPDDALWMRVAALPQKQRVALTLRFLGDCTHREIARAMDTSEPAARRNVHEALRRLRAELPRH